MSESKPDVTVMRLLDRGVKALESIAGSMRNHDPRPLTFNNPGTVVRIPAYLMGRESEVAIPDIPNGHAILDGENLVITIPRRNFTELVHQIVNDEVVVAATVGLTYRPKPAVDES